MFKILFPPEIMIFFLQNFKSYFIVILNYLETFKIFAVSRTYKF